MKTTNRRRDLGWAVALAMVALGAGRADAAPDPNAITEARLDNGMKVLIWPDHDIPNVALTIWFKVGSRNEAPGITGGIKGAKEDPRDVIAFYFDHALIGDHPTLYGLPDDEIDGYLGRMAAVTPAHAREVIADAMPEGKDLVIVLIGNAAAIRDVAAGYGPVEEKDLRAAGF